MYTDFATHYDLMMADVDYASWADAIVRRLTERGILPGMKICECACGTGSLTIPLAETGYRMCGVDLSGEMLARAMDKSRRAGLLIPYIRQDMTRMELPGKQDAVLCTCDGVNYLDDDGCRAFFQRAFRYTRQGGVILFDVSTPHKLIHTLGGSTLTRIEDDYCYIWENSLSRDKKRLTIRLTGFVRNPKGSYDRFEEDQVQYAHTSDELTGMLREAGFGEIGVFGGGLKDKANEKDERWHFIAAHP